MEKYRSFMDKYRSFMDKYRAFRKSTAHLWKSTSVVILHKVSGTANPADALTKVLAVKYAFKEYMAKLYNVGIHML